MQLFDSPGDHGALGILPGAGANSIACIDKLRIVQGRSLGALVGTPGAVTGACGLCQGLGNAGLPLEAAEVSPLPGPTLVTKKVIVPGPGLSWADAGPKPRGRKASEANGATWRM